MAEKNYAGAGQQIQWYPGHMTKTRRRMEECLRLVDGVVEILDARIPMSSRNPDIDDIVGRKPRLVLLNKADVADAASTDRWIGWFARQGVRAIACDCKTGKGLNRFADEVRTMLSDKIRSWQEKGMGGRSIRLMVVGIPNVGKSSFINRMAKGAKARVADKPGVTRGNQWFTIGGGIELLDTPGVLWPKFDDPEVGRRLAFTGAVKDAVVDVESLALDLLREMSLYYPERLCERYKLETAQDAEPLELMETIARKRGMMLRGGEYDYERVSVMLLDEYRAGKLGRITLERK
ncbi:MAG: ribosome biogenesis GTPase YlqF [Clostridia bacterium]|nr:ribosome biogenesis GTPase YlqF [Clostridia bacterium]MBQ5544240.1 ribosome biogenesis GTPase YlqF [Clostridia bacterium]